MPDYYQRGYFDKRNEIIKFKNMSLNVNLEAGINYRNVNNIGNSDIKMPRKQYIISAGHQL